MCGNQRRVIACTFLSSLKCGKVLVQENQTRDLMNEQMGILIRKLEVNPVGTAIIN